MLKYTGGGFKGFIPGVPARDLTADEVKKFGKKMLLNSGLYIMPNDKKEKQEVDNARE